jgi:sterol desaturase/sphingolipid hydroxylase (fatty acid hydroxylase superfamily)
MLWCDAIGQVFDWTQQGLFEQVVEPLLQRAGEGGWAEDAFDATGWLLIGLIEIGVLLLLIRPLERWRPVEPVTDRAAVRVDIVYTLIHRLGLVQIAMFFMLQPAWDAVSGWARLAGLSTWHIDALVASAWPGVTDTAVFSLVLYLVVFDLLDYLLHRGQHRFGWWWTLHAVHHSQRQMTMWSDDREHLLDDAIRVTAFALVARLIGVPPSQYIAIVAATQVVQSLAHANTRLGFGWLGDRLVVGPRFHRIHHAAEPSQPGSMSTPPSCNYASLFPVWDILFRTAKFHGGQAPTGIRDQWPVHGARDYGRSLFSQQVLALDRLRLTLAPRRRSQPWNRHD